MSQYFKNLKLELSSWMLFLSKLNWKDSSLQNSSLICCRNSSSGVAGEEPGSREKIKVLTDGCRSPES